MRSHYMPTLNQWESSILERSKVNKVNGLLCNFYMLHIKVLMLDINSWSNYLFIEPKITNMMLNETFNFPTSWVRRAQFGKSLKSYLIMNWSPTTGASMPNININESNPAREIGMLQMAKYFRRVTAIRKSLWRLSIIIDKLLTRALVLKLQNPWTLPLDPFPSSLLQTFFTLLTAGSKSNIANGIFILLN